MAWQTGTLPIHRVGLFEAVSVSPISPSDYIHELFQKNSYVAQNDYFSVRMLRSHSEMFCKTSPRSEHKAQGLGIIRCQGWRFVPCRFSVSRLRVKTHLFLESAPPADLLTSPIYRSDRCNHCMSAGKKHWWNESDCTRIAGVNPSIILFYAHLRCHQFLV